MLTAVVEESINIVPIVVTLQKSRISTVQGLIWTGFGSETLGGLKSPPLTFQYTTSLSIFSMHIIELDFSILLSMADINLFVVYCNILEGKLYHVRLFIP